MCLSVFSPFSLSLSHMAISACSFRSSSSSSSSSACAGAFDLPLTGRLGGRVSEEMRIKENNRKRQEERKIFSLRDQVHPAIDGRQASKRASDGWMD